MVRESRERAARAGTPEAKQREVLGAVERWKQEVALEYRVCASPLTLSTRDIWWSASSSPSLKVSLQRLYFPSCFFPQVHPLRVAASLACGA